MLYSATAPRKVTGEVSSLGEDRLDTSAGPLTPAQKKVLKEKNARMDKLIKAVKDNLDSAEV